MYCENCGTKLRDGAKFCRNCGKQIGQSMPYSKNVFSNVTQPLAGENGEMTSPIKADIPESGEGLTGWFKNRRNVVICIVLAVLIIMLVVCGILFVKHLQKPQEEPDTEQIEAATEATEEILEDISEEIKEEMMLVVKGEKAVNYPEITYEEAFANYFTSPEWTCFRGTKEGPDDDGDGNPDYELEGIEIVQFTGDCVYSDAQVKALIQFCKDNDTGIYQITYVSFDGKPQSTSVMSEFVDVIFRTYVEATTVIEETEVVESVEAEEDIFYYDDYLYWAGRYEGERFTVEMHMYTGLYETDTQQGTIFVYENETGTIICSGTLEKSGDINDGDNGAPWIPEFNGYFNDDAPWRTQYTILYQFADRGSVLYDVGCYSIDGVYYIELGSLDTYYERLKMVEHFES